MRSILLFSVLLLGASWMAAQTTTTGQGATGQSNGYGQTGNTHATGTQKTVTGCLSEAGGKYMLTDRKGMTYELMGDSSQLSNHVGHEVKITGTESAADASGAAGSNGMGQTSANGPTIEVSSVKHISKTCKNAGNTGGTGGMSH
jgi:hypothetical protein